ncbi:MAG: ShlB/FhaC/HecB family hemolysin secretion/activation protein [Verrucomicrobiales bacterium]|nr:ShlB/FhaC/HecB family hemolysin secretion/activation protein [Verrucomicrobiales bacterium]
MERLLITAALLAGLTLPASVMAQDLSPLGDLPPVPNLSTGNDKDKNLVNRMKDRRKAAEDQNKRRQIANQESRKRKSATGKDQVRKAGTPGPSNAEKPAQARRMGNQVPGQITAPPESMTPSGTRLKPFGAEDFWQGEELPPEENIIDLPELPDLRTPAQKSWMDKYREARVAKFEARHEQLEREKEAAEKAKKMAAIKRRPPDPSTALVKVQRQPVLYDYNGVPIIPETPTGHKLKAFNQNARYVQDNQLVFQGQRPPRPQTTWINRGLSPGAGDPQASKWEWKNPFAAGPSGNTSYDVSGLGDGGAGAPVIVPQEDNTPLMDQLRGIRIVSGTRDVQKGGLGGVSGIVNEGVNLPEKAEAALAAYLGQSLTLGTLNQMVRDTVVAYRESDLPVIDVLVPEQEVTSGVLQLVIIEGRIGDIMVEGVSGATADLLASYIRLERGEVIRESVLLDDLNWMNKHPFRRVDLVYAPGADYGSTDIILRTEELKEWHLYTGYDNSGNAILGEGRFTAGASVLGPLFFSEENIFSYQYTSNIANDSDLIGHSAVFSSYLPWRHVFTILGAYVESEAVIPIDGDELATGGRNQQLSARYDIPLPSLGKWGHDFELGVDFKSSNSALSFNTLEVFDSTSEIVQFSLGYNARRNDRRGAWTIDSELVISPGDMTSKATDEVYETQRALASSDYIYGRIMAEREQNLPKQWQLIGRVQAQASGANLLPSETLGAGGYDSVRGFEQRIARGDNGFVGTAELRTPPVSPARLAGFYNARDALVGLVFFDYANLVSSEKLPMEESLTLGSVGVGLRYQLDDNFSLRLDYGEQLIEEGFEDGERGRFHVGARATF